MIQRTGNIKLDDMMKRRKHRAIEHESEDIFADHDITVSNIIQCP